MNGSAVLGAAEKANMSCTLCCCYVIAVATAEQERPGLQRRGQWSVLELLMQD